ncbi:hypothetical protein [Pseudoduganella namucuonensis]|uniref:Uncharacterized protein n=1 Tax=Pseudoduganella namucuonensis TaxID=1035707 RepID=A0A1I7M2E3_9BURK|nr:hypothetical protein [Pseudoduganella namucuonensis]SFV16096.1 hypothetical protein SAMN05216552_104942 [Pseudoduganella namucuonensis]
MPRGASPKREREYNELEEKFEKEGRYKGREEEVAARIVNKQRREQGETKEQKKTAARKGGAGGELPIGDYQKLTVPEIRSRLDELTAAQRRKIRSFELAHKHRKGVLEALDRPAR